MNTPTFPSAIPGIEPIHQGKVRDTFAVPGRPDLLLLVATDRISTHNIIHRSTIPGKGIALTALSVFWMEKLRKEYLIPTHLRDYGTGIYGYFPKGDCPDDLHRRAIIVGKADVIPIEFIFRERMAGSLWKDFYSKGLPNPYGLILPAGLGLMSPFHAPAFTPTRKSEHDEPVPADETERNYPEASELALTAYDVIHDHAFRKGIEIIDGKEEIGIDRVSGRITLIDECGTPDCCRFIEAGSAVVGEEPRWLDKQFVREEAERAWAGGKKVPLEFTDAVISETSGRYREIVTRLTGVDLDRLISEQFDA